MALKRIRLELARTPESPEGNSSCGYEFTAPLDNKGKLDPKQVGSRQGQMHCAAFLAQHDG